MYVITIKDIDIAQKVIRALAVRFPEYSTSTTSMYTVVGGAEYKIVSKYIGDIKPSTREANADMIAMRLYAEGYSAALQVENGELEDLLGKGMCYDVGGMSFR